MYQKKSEQNKNDILLQEQQNFYKCHYFSIIMYDNDEEIDIYIESNLMI